MTKDQILAIIQQEITWSRQNHSSPMTEYERGFIAGLEQAVLLISKASTLTNQTETT